MTIAQTTLTLKEHEKGVNCVTSCSNDDNVHLVSSGDDYRVKTWDLQVRNIYSLVYENEFDYFKQTNSWIQTLEGHSHNVTCVGFHSQLTILFSASEDGTVKLWHSNTFSLESILNFDLGRCWTISYL